MLIGWIIISFVLRRWILLEVLNLLILCGEIFFHLCQLIAQLSHFVNRLRLDSSFVLRCRFLFLIILGRFGNKLIELLSLFCCQDNLPLIIGRQRVNGKRGGDSRKC